MIYVIGECMIEFSRAETGGGELFRRSFAGDVYNTGVYAKRLAPAGVGVEFVTAVGDDAASAAMTAQWRAEGIGAVHAAVITGGAPGLYVIDTDDAGERRFSYWRSASAARRLMRGVASVDASRLGDRDVVYYSGITLAILERADREALFGFVEAARRAGAVVAFDPNYRPALWERREAAAEAIIEAYRNADIVLTGAEEEQGLFDLDAGQPPLDRLERLGVREAILKAGEDGIFVRRDGEEIQIPFVGAARVVDTTAAGDSFAGAYLAFRLRGDRSEAAARRAAAVARIVVSHPGAVVDRADFAAQIGRDPELSDEL